MRLFLFVSFLLLVSLVNSSGFTEEGVTKTAIQYVELQLPPEVTKKHAGMRDWFVKHGKEFIGSDPFKKAFEKFPDHYRNHLHSYLTNKGFTGFPGDVYSALNKMNQQILSVKNGGSLVLSASLESIAEFISEIQNGVKDDVKLADLVVDKLLEFLKDELKDSKDDLCIQMHALCAQALAPKPSVEPPTDSTSPSPFPGGKILIAVLVVFVIVAIVAVIVFISKRQKQ